MAASDMMSALMELCRREAHRPALPDRPPGAVARQDYAEILHLEWGAKVTIDRTTGKIYVYRLEPIDDSMDEEGNFTEFEEIDVTPKNTSRIAAQHAKAEINAIVRNSAREQIYEEFSGRIGDLISGTVLQSTPDFTIVKIREGVEAELPHFDQRRYENERNERPMGERYLHNQHIKAVIIDVRDPNSNLQPVRGEHSRPPIVISCTHPELMRRLFEQEVPEIYEGTVQIKSIAREPGQRSRLPSTRSTTVWIPLAPASAPRAAVFALSWASSVASVSTSSFGMPILLSTSPTPFRPPRSPASSSTRRRLTPASSCPTTSCPSPSARRARTPASPRA